MSDVINPNDADNFQNIESNILVPESSKGTEGKKITRVPNDMNDLVFSRKFNRTGHNIYFTLIHKIRLKMPDIPPPVNTDVPSVEIVLTYYEIDEIAKISRSHINRVNGASIKNTFDEFFKTLWEQTFVTSKNEKTTYDRFIYKCDINDTDKEIKLYVNYYVAKAMYDYHIKCGYTSFEIGEFVCLHSIYSKTIYRKLKQWKTVGSWTVKIDEFRSLLSIPESYRMGDIDKRVISVAIAELSKELDLFDDKRIPFKNLKCEKIKKSAPGRGGKVEALRWTFDKHIPDKLPTFLDEDKKTDDNGQNKSTKVNDVVDVYAEVSDVEVNDVVDVYAEVSDVEVNSENSAVNE